jgi:hypothetical protein
LSFESTPTFILIVAVVVSIQVLLDFKYQHHCIFPKQFSIGKGSGGCPDNRVKGLADVSDDPIRQSGCDKSLDGYSNDCPGISAELGEFATTGRNGCQTPKIGTFAANLGLTVDCRSEKLWLFTLRTRRRGLWKPAAVRYAVTRVRGGTW